MDSVLLILQRCALRHWRMAWRQQVTLLLILALGCGVYLSVRLANRAALSGFQKFAKGVTRDSDWSLVPAAGLFRMEWLRVAREAMGLRPVHLLPMVESQVAPAVEEEQRVIGSRARWQLVGTDLVALLNLRGETAELPKVTSWPGGSAVMVTVAFAQQQGLQIGSPLRIVAGEEVQTLTVAALIPEIPDLPSPPQNLLLMDLPDAQRLLKREGLVDRVEVLVQRGAAFPNLREEVGEKLLAASQQRWEVQSHEDRSALASTMTAAFRLNLSILSLLSLFVGGYLIYQALDGVVLRRRAEIGVLKSLGVTDGSIQCAFLIEALLLGLLGGCLGLLLGWAGAQGAVLAVTQTMNALYGATEAQTADLPASEAILTLLLGVGMSLLAAAWPARNAARTPPVQMMGNHAVSYGGRSSAWAERMGWLALLTAVALGQCSPWRMADGTRVPFAAYAAAALWLLGAGFAAGGLLRWLGQASRALAAKSAVWRIALAQLRRPSARHRLAVAALTSAVAMTAGMVVMVGSFDHTMRDWIQRSMKADIYVASAADQSGGANHLISAATVKELAAQPGIRECATLMASRIRYGEGKCWLLGEMAEAVHRHGLHTWVAEPAPQWWLKPDVCLVNESFSERHEVQLGSSIQVPTPSGPRELRVAGIFTDYGNEHGSIVLPQERYAELCQTEDVWRIALFTEPSADADQLRDAMQQAHPGLSIFTNAHLRSEALRIFTQTFSVTYALEVIGVVVAVAGLGLALASLLLERQAAQDTLRALGMTRAEALQAAALEGVCLAAVGSLAGLAGGLCLGWLLIYRVNKQCFGWTLGYHAPLLQLSALVLAVVCVGAGVAAAVAWIRFRRAV